MKKSFSYLLLVLIILPILYVASDEINYKETYSLQNLIDNKLYVGVATFIRTQNLRPILKLNRLELWQEKNDNLVKNLNRKQFG